MFDSTSRSLHVGEPLEHAGEQQLADDRQRVRARLRRPGHAHELRRVHASDPSSTRRSSAGSCRCAPRPGCRSPRANAQNASSSGAGSSVPFGNAEITTPRWPRSMAALHLGDGVVDAGGRQDRLSDQPTVGPFAELGEPVVVGADARHLELGLGAVDLGAEERDARVEHLQVDAVDVHVGEPRLGVEAARPHRLVAARRRARSRGTTSPAVAVRPTGRTLSPSLNDQKSPSSRWTTFGARSLNFAGTRPTQVSGGSLTCASQSRIG